MLPHPYRLTLSAALLAAAFAVRALAQTAPVSIRVLQDDQVIGVSNNGSVNLNTRVGTTLKAEVQITYRGDSTLVVPTPAELVGSPAFTVESAGVFPVTLTSGQTIRVSVTYQPRSSTTTSAQLTLPVREQLRDIQVGGLVVVNFAGTAPDFAVSYILPTDGNVVVLNSGGLIELPPILPNTTTSVVMSIANRGSGPGSIQSISVAGEGFQAVGIPLLPVFLESGREVRFGIRLLGRPAGTYTGTLTIGFASGEIQRFNLSTEVVAVQPVYELALNDRIEALNPGQLVNLGQINPNETLGFQVTIRNPGKIDLPVNNLSLLGSAFTGVDFPATTRTLAAGQTIRVSATFAPTAPGTYRARLRFNEDALDFVAVATGIRLQYSYTVASSVPVIVVSGNSVFFPATAVGARNRVNFEVLNSGSGPANVIQINLEGVRSGFSLLNLPTLPITLQPNERFTFGIEFAPLSPGTNLGSLRVDAATFPILIAAPNPSELPPLQFTIPSGTVQALEQPSFGLRATRPYPLEIRGTLTLAQEPLAFITDPSVRFINGQNSIEFSIPANTTEALFPSGSTTTRIQAGSTAGEILVRAAVTAPVVSGDTQAPLALLRLTVPPTAPRLLEVVAVRTGAALTLRFSGISTSRSLTRAELEFKPAPGVTLANAKVTISLEAESLRWFRSAESQGFGGVFQLTVPLSLGGADLSKPVLESVTASVANERGSSNTVTAAIP